MSEQTDFSLLVDENCKLRGVIQFDYNYFKFLLDGDSIVGQAVDMVQNRRLYMRRDFPWLEDE